MKVIKKAIPVLTASIIFLTPVTGTFAASPTDVTDRETVYSLLNPDGTVKKSIVVDWLQLKGNGNVTVKDIGQLKNLKNVSGTEKPSIQDGQIIWNTQVNGEKSIYYSGETNQQLPVDVSISYYLDGQKMDAASIAGKNGTVKIEVKLKNLLKQNKTITYQGYNGAKQSIKTDLVTPMLSLVSINIPSDHFTDMKLGDAITVMTGKQLNATWMVVPNPEETITLEMKGTNIEFEPITITLIPKLPSVPEVPVKGQLEQLTSGVQQISTALEQFGNGVTQLANGNRQIKNGLNGLSQGIDQLIQVNQAQTALLKQSLDTNQQILAIAQQLATQKPEDQSLQLLLQAVQGEQQMLTVLANGGMLQGQPFPGLNTMNEGLNQSRSGADQLATGADQLEKGILDFGTGITKLSGRVVEMKNGLITGLDKLYEGEASLNQSKAAAEQYNTFLGKPEGANGEVRFILKTDAIKKEQAKGLLEQKTIGTTENKKVESTSFLGKIIKFFTNLF